ncbi:MAG: hypothetical protein WDW36_002167 [Sanguina aurantia]
MAADVGRGPRSWAEDCNSYRETRGSRSFGTLDRMREGTPTRYCRTNYAPFADYKHPLFLGDDFKHPDQPQGNTDLTVYQQRCIRHGWGDLSLLKEDGMENAPLRAAGHERPGKGQLSSPRPKDGRNGLFGVLQMSEAGQQDSWIGNPLVNPTKGRRAVALPADPKGRKDLFDVLHSRNPGGPSDDSWMGNQLVDPAKGKASCADQVSGRKGLNAVMQMEVLRDPQRLQMLSKGADPLGDAWCGHRLIDPSRGRLPVESSASQNQLLGSTFKGPVIEDHSDLPRRHTKAVARAQSTTGVAELLSGKAHGDDWGRLARRPSGPAACKFDGRTDLYANMTYRPLTGQEVMMYGRAWDDGGLVGKAIVKPPHDTSRMLHWRPTQRLPNFVPFAGLMQETRRDKPREVK